MDKQKQIEEMTLKIAKLFCNPKGCYNYNLCDEYGYLELSCEEYLSYRRVASVLYAAGYRKQSGWISVDERLPEDGSPVVVYLQSGGITIARYDMAWGRFRTSGSITITHWMPLPEPPKGE